MVTNSKRPKPKVPLTASDDSDSDMSVITNSHTQSDVPSSIPAIPETNMVDDLIDITSASEYDLTDAEATDVK
jgi:hypothetical protein